MYTLKSIVRRGTALGAAVAVFAAAIVPTAPAFADALNPLTERSLLLSSSAPGFQDTDGSNYSTDTANPAADPPDVPGTYAPAGSGPNGKKSGETFTFRVSTGNPPLLHGISFQYCTEAAGKCQAPGDNVGDARVGATTPREDNATAHAHAAPNKKSDLDIVGPFANGTGAGEFAVYINDNPTPVSGWTFAASNLEDTTHSGALTGKNNYVTLANTTGVSLAAGDKVQIVFKPSESVYITNPGSGSFFVKINTYSTATPAAMIGGHNDPTPGDESDHTVIDGGVTVANVMTDSIHITTKVLETMSFSVGTRNKDTQNEQHGICDPIQVVNNNRLNLGNPDAEYSLETDQAYDVFSYWRLSSNSSGGATVYYSGNTLANTVGDEINEMGTEKNSQPGTEQFGLAVIDAGLDTLDTAHPDGFPAEHITPNVAPLVVGTAYDEGGFQGDNDISSITTADNAKFAFHKSSNTVPEVIAQNTDQVISCATAKMRYVANIGADTPAGVYTTKVNYLAAPQY